MATFSNVLGLKLNDPTDPFLLSDFTANWNLIDGSPGTFICTSGTRPSWGASQTGRLIFMTDLKQLSYWSGSSWQDLRDSAPVFAGAQLLNQSIAKNTSVSQTILNLTTPRPSAMAIVLAATYQCSNKQNQDAFQSVLFDGTAYTMGFREQVRFSGNASDSGNTAGYQTTSVAIVPSVTAGAHTAGIKVDVSNNYSTSITLVGVKVLAFISLYSATNVL